MARTAAVNLSEEQAKGQFKPDRLWFWSFAAHGSIVVFVGFGWLSSSRSLLYFYTLLLPVIAFQWLLNRGCSIVNNVECLLRIGRWELPEKVTPHGFFRTILRALGIRATGAQITTAVCGLMLMFWVCAICRMMLIVSGS